MDDWHRGQPERAKGSNESAMVRFLITVSAANLFPSLMLSSFC
jgi:hypothetical protein